MDLDSEIPLMNPQYSHSGTQLEPSISFASIEFNRQSGKRMRTNRGNLPFDVWDNTAPNTLPPTIFFFFFFKNSVGLRIYILRVY